jgi:6,7-dimethyl-8-ribityllumazine synthase
MVQRSDQSGRRPAAGPEPVQGIPSWDNPHLMIVEARFYTELADELARGATETLAEAGATWDRVEVPGAFEIPAAIRFAVKSMDITPTRRRYDGYIALGCVIRGETSHYDYVCGESARGLQDLALHHSLAIGYGILTVENEEQAWARAAIDRGNKGRAAAEAALAMIALKRRFGLFPR